MVTTVKSPAIYPVIVETDLANLRTYNFYVVENNHKLFLVDAGNDDEESWDQLQHVLKENGYTLYDLDAILLTHHHFDHVGLVNRIAEEHPIPVYAHKNSIVRLRREEEYIESRIHFFKKLYKDMGCDIERVAKEIERLRVYVDKNEKQIINSEINILREGDKIFGFEVFEVIGHSLDHIAFYHQESEKILVGDHMIQHMSSNALIDIGEGGKRPLSLVYYEKSLKRLLDLPMKTVYPGHGAIITEPYKLLDEKLGRIRDRSHLILQMLNKPQTPASIAEKIYKDRYDSLFPLVMSEIIGHIDRLEYYGRIKRTVKNGVNYYERARRPRI